MYKFLPFLAFLFLIASCSEDASYINNNNIGFSGAFIVRNSEFCNRSHTGHYEGLYDWIDYAEKGESRFIAMAGCFDPNIISGSISDGIYPLSDQWGTYYGDKDGGEYNVRRISYATGTEQIIFTASGYGDLPIIKTGGEFFLYGFKLEGLADINMLRSIPTATGSSYFLLTDYHNPVIWTYKDKIKMNPDSAYEKEPGLIVNKTDCVSYYPSIQTYPSMDIQHIQNCDPETIHFLSGSILLIDKNGCYIREQKLEGCNPKKVKYITYTAHNQYESSAWKKKFYGTEWRQVTFFDGIHSYDIDGNLLQE